MMTAREIQDFIHLFSMVLFADGRREPGILINKYNSVSGHIDFFFIPHHHMQSYKNAFENYDRETCHRLSYRVDLKDIASVRLVTLSDYKIIMQLLEEKEMLQSIQ